jgi:hypothetical protein
MQIGDKWLRAQTSAVLEVPSVIVPSESDFLLSRGRRVDFENVWDSRSPGLPLFPNHLVGSSPLWLGARA